MMKETNAHGEGSGSRSGARALSLLSGGLDSQLAILVLRGQGVDVTAVAFDSPFFDTTRARKAAEGLGVPLLVLDFTDDILRILRKPKHGFGACMNPCIDCHTQMVRCAGEEAARSGFDFVATGEVLDQRPMSQNRRCLGIVANESGYADILVRPMSAKLLAETKPEREGLIDRNRLLGFSGRTRRPQMALAREYGLADYPTPAGGCRLTEPNFCARLRDLIEHEGITDRRSLELLKCGRHFRLGPATKLILGRDEKDNAMIEQRASECDALMIPGDDIPGPTGLLPASADGDAIRLAAGLLAHYSDCPPGKALCVIVKTAAGVQTMDAVPVGQDAVDANMIELKTKGSQPV
ncbi:MAG: tRNA 4-thiouridine(8) synthase ThiI [Lentisphaerae bacterium]|nr:tRNA 4-thiouridine(8) synthase ThiI [Lentisphaerota bacterium]